MDRLHNKYSDTRQGQYTKQKAFNSNMEYSGDGTSLIMGATPKQHQHDFFFYHKSPFRN